MGRLTLVPTPFLLTTTAFLCAVAFFLYLDVSGDQASRAQLSTRLDKIERRLDSLKSSIGTELKELIQKIPKETSVPLLTQLLNIGWSSAKNTVKGIGLISLEIVRFFVDAAQCLSGVVCSKQDECIYVKETVSLWSRGIKCKVHQDSSFACGWAQKE